MYSQPPSQLFLTMCDALQLQSSILLGSLSLITNNTLRYACLGLATGISAIYVSYLMRPSMQLRLLEDTIQSTENAIIGAKAHCPRDRNLMEQGVRLLEIKRSASTIRCRMLKMRGLAWRTYLCLSKEISDRKKDLMNIHTAVQLTVETELQRTYTEDIYETEAILLSAVRSPQVVDGDAASYPSNDLWHVRQPLYRFASFLYLLI
ncbi:hypothetical protein B0H13DRAFT_1983961, partial [Mycena leptocephala]